MRPLAFFVFASVTIVTCSLSAQQTNSPAAAKPKTASTPSAEASPTPEKKRSFLGRVFKGKDEEAPAPAAPTTPPPAPKPKPKPKPAETPTPSAPAEAPVKSESVAAPAETEKKAPETSTPPPSEAPKEKTESKPATATEKKSSKSTAKGKKSAPPKIITITPDMDDTALQEAFQILKIQALEDADLKALKDKADNTVASGESHTATVAYNRALFNKIRQIEPKMKDYTERVESSLMKILNAEKSGQ